MKHNYSLLLSLAITSSLHSSATNEQPKTKRVSLWSPYRRPSGKKEPSEKKGLALLAQLLREQRKRDKKKYHFVTSADFTS